MNEKIKELAKQSGVYFGDASMDYFGDVWPAYVNTEKIDFEKFAELVVRECIDVLNKAVYLATREDGEQECIEVVLLEHFELNNERTN